MVRSEERKIEYCVIVMPRYRECPPICYKGYAKNEDEAENIVFNSNWHKEILDVKKSTEMQWNLETIKMYWSMYGRVIDEKLKYSEVKLF